MKKVLTPGLLGLLLLTACNMNGSVMENMDEDSAMSEPTEEMMVEDDAPSADEAMPPAGEENPDVEVEVEVDAEASVPRVIEVTASDWTFAPNALTVKQGENVVIRLTGVQGMHSLMIKDLNLNVEIAAGETKDIVIPTDVAGTFAMQCAVPCGPGHKEMLGTLVIEAA